MKRAKMALYKTLRRFEVKNNDSMKLLVLLENFESNGGKNEKNPMR